jgi:DNA-binding protein H-NS
MNTLTLFAPLYETLAREYQSTAEMILDSLHYFDSRRIEEQREHANQMRQKADDLRRHAEALRRQATDLESLLKTDRSLAPSAA